MSHADLVSTEQPSPASSAPFQGRKGLVVDDNPTNLKLAAAMLKGLGITAECVEDGQAAVECVTREGSHYDFILMDCEMPILDGYRTVAAIRDIEHRQGLGRTPIIALSAHSAPEFKHRSLSAGMDGHLTKPFKLIQLVEILSRHIASVD